MASEIFNATIPISVGRFTLPGDLIIPEKASGLVIFSHGSGSSRLSSRNRYVAKVLQEHGIATLLFDLLTPEEDQDYQKRFEIPLLTERLVAVTNWVFENENTSNFTIGYFGSSTGAASALGAAAVLGKKVKAVVSRGGRPDMAIPVLPNVSAPVLLLVGSNDGQVIELNQQAYDQMPGTKEMKLISGATHLFEEPGTLEQVAEQAAAWFKKYL
ncbi:dienelactone hydrolase family protein [Adhaeribacter sp. BT258]|uniref:Dienelactone hydrolase family protein n=1 Tax=Adhaeribacter terrigena TaxID=2793070 RepID=A0ABS1BXC1_9BACT|nr:alpha/beta family hydrolase [Adhaeribacter terrigena]MBK0401678.1 dienelactone hydrolase family protein [Adhaeribacter terrigena]